MYWKQIPNEEPAQNPKEKTHISAKFVGTSNSNGVVHSNISYRLFQKVSGKLLNFIKKERSFKVDELSDLIKA